MRGSCLCGEIAYEIDQLDSTISHCHCHTCRKAHSAAYASTARVDRIHFRWLQGRDSLASYESSAGKLRHFCKHCGSHLVAERTGQTYLILRVASLDVDPQARPTAHIWCSHDATWLTDDASVERFEKWPPGR